MLKPLTLSLGLALALSLSGVSKAGGLFHNESGCATCGLASPQGPAVSPQAACPSPQVECVQPCSKPKCNLFSGMGHKMSCGLDKMSCGMKDMGCGLKDLCGKLKPKPKCYTYEWVLKKKRVKGCHGNCGSPACETCAVTPSAQGAPSPQAAGSPQAGYASAPASYSTGQIAAATPVGTYAPAPAPVMINGDEAPPAPAAPGFPTTPTPVAPAPPAPPAPGATSGLLFSTPSGN